MKITEKDIEKLINTNLLEIIDDNEYAWVLKLEDDFLNVSYGKSYKPISYNSLIFVPQKCEFLKKLNVSAEKAKLNFKEEIKMSHMFYHYG